VSPYKHRIFVGGVLFEASRVYLCYGRQFTHGYKVAKTIYPACAKGDPAVLGREKTDLKAAEEAM
jgi:hypothetical protein